MDELFKDEAGSTVIDITRIINGGEKGLAERMEFYKSCEKIFK